MGGYQARGTSFFLPPIRGTYCGLSSDYCLEPSISSKQNKPPIGASKGLFPQLDPFVPDPLSLAFLTNITFQSLQILKQSLCTHDYSGRSGHSVSYLTLLPLDLCSQLTTYDAINRLLCGICCVEGMTVSALDDEITTDSRFLWPSDPTPSYAPTPGYFGGTWSPSVGYASPQPEQGEDRRSPPAESPGFTQQVEEHDEELPDEQSSDSTRYTYLIERRLTLNHRVIAKDTEQDLDEPPSIVWPKILSEVAQVLQSKLARNRRVRPDDTNVVVSVNDRSQRDLIKRFTSTDINWLAIEKQLTTWARLSQLGKVLRLKISVNYIEENSLLSSKSDKRGKSSVSKRMLADRDAQLGAEEASGQPSVWKKIYSMMRCPGPPCRHDGQYCWQDPVGKRHYKLRTHHLRSIIRFVEQGGTVENHGDIPDNIREQLYAEDNEWIAKQRGPAIVPPGSMCPPININVLPNQPLQTAMTDVNSSVFSVSSISHPDPIDIPGLHDIAVVEYSDWQQSRVSSEALKDDVRKARDLVLANGLDLKQIHSDQDPDFFIKKGVKMGVARRFVCEITEWVHNLRPAATEIS